MGRKKYGIAVPRVRDDGLQVEDSTRAQRIFWVVERCGWALFAALLLLAMFGLTGSGGPFARAVVQDGSGRVDYPAIARWHTSDDLRVTFAGNATTHTLEVSQAFVDAFEIGSMQPRPATSTTLADGMRFTFEAGPDAGVSASVFVTPLNVGWMDYAVRIDGGASQEVRTLVLP
ncbi:hypothetical protein [Pelagibacterium xiamenense]|uniref:hypothetical protein n=1 Tax=Pelagibacterium xiamenense TaxID=2901140 RepID=UPI001E5517FD|nr:hypothetical protein [Pelagibacterium xiamenense]MCD7059002.1 hypothetical protein [Pelagibacterium xiamenense]